MKYEADRCQVVMVYGGEKAVIATCSDENMAIKLARLLREDGSTPYTNSAGTSMVRIEGHDLKSLQTMLCSKETGRKPYLLRVDQRGDTVAFKVNESTWTHGMGKPQAAY